MSDCSQLVQQLGQMSPYYNVHDGPLEKQHKRPLPEVASFYLLRIYGHFSQSCTTQSGCRRRCELSENLMFWYTDCSTCLACVRGVLFNI